MNAACPISASAYTHTAHARTHKAHPVRALARALTNTAAAVETYDAAGFVGKERCSAEAVAVGESELPHVLAHRVSAERTRTR